MVPVTVDQRVIGTVAEVAELLRRRSAAGELVAMTAPAPTADGRVSLTMTIRTTSAAPTTGGWLRPALFCAGVLAAGAAVAGLVWVVWVAVAAVVAWLAVWWPVAILAVVMPGWLLWRTGPPRPGR